MELFAGIRTDDHQQRQRDYQAGATDDKAEQKCGKSHQNESFKRVPAYRTAVLDERTDKRNDPDQDQETAENRGEISGAHLDGGAHLEVANEEDRRNSDSDIDDAGPEILRTAND